VDTSLVATVPALNNPHALPLPTSIGRIGTIAILMVVIMMTPTLAGGDNDDTHTSTLCGNQGPTHNPNATRANMMGVSIAGVHKTILP
jgi:hypothetical protein